MILYSIEDMKMMLPDNFAVFGAGNVARLFLGYCANAKWTIQEILVSKSSDNPKEIRGIEVMQLEAVALDSSITVVVCTTEDKHAEITDILTAKGIKSIFYVSNGLYAELQEKLNGKGQNWKREFQEIKNSIRSIENYKKFISRPCFEVLIVNILDHCNLRCQGCDHFACIADPYIVPKDTIFSDLRKMSQILGGDYVMRLCVMGGEPLLHPDLNEILKFARNSFPKVSLRLYSNGVFLLKQKDSFWECCRDFNIELYITKYPINLDFPEMKRRSDREGVKLVFWFGTDTYVKESFKKVIDLSGQNNPVESFAKCEISNFGNFLMEGRLYGCPFSCQAVRIFNKKFNQELRQVEDDYLDIYEVSDKKELFDFAARPKFFCRYCDGRTHTFPWKRTTGLMDEWVENIGGV